MTAQVVLSEQQSSLSGPYGYYTVTLTPSSRTLDGVTILCEVSAHLAEQTSTTGYGVTCGLYIGGEWHDFTLVEYGTTWSGTGEKTASTTVTLTGLSATQTSITGIQFRALDGVEPHEGPTLYDTNCANLTIDMYGGIAKVKYNGAWKQAVPYVKDNGAWKQAVPYVKDGGAWKIGT